MADPDKEDEIDEIESPGYRMAHARHPKAMNILPAKSEERPEDNACKKACGDDERPARSSQGGKDSIIFAGQASLSIMPFLPQVVDFGSV
jgi:hypothetical protein